jgi:hypothetical protein
MDEGRKRVIGIMAAILTSLHMETADDLFGGPQGSPRTDKLIAASVQWAVLIMWMMCAGGERCSTKQAQKSLRRPARGQISQTRMRQRGTWREVNLFPASVFRQLAPFGPRSLRRSLSSFSTLSSSTCIFDSALSSLVCFILPPA